MTSLIYFGFPPIEPIFRKLYFKFFPIKQLHFSPIVIKVNKNRSNKKQISLKFVVKISETNYIKKKKYYSTLIIQNN